MNIGTRLGTVLINPSLKLRSTAIRIAEIRSKASVLPIIMLSIFLLAMCENIIRGLAPCEAISGGAFSLNHFCALFSKARACCVDTLSRIAVKRVDDLSILIWLFRSKPKGRDNSYNNKYWADRSRSSGRR